MMHENTWKMDNLSRESSFMSQGTMDVVMNQIGGVSSLECFKEDLEIYLKQEQPLSANECFQQDIPFNLYSYTLETLPADSTQNRGPLIPLSTSTMPSVETYLGPYDFDVDLCKTEGDKAKWEYSESLNKLYVVMGGKVPVKFKWNQNEFGLCVRALPIFLAQDHFAEPVQRCPSHASSLESSNKDFLHVNHIIRCHSTNSQYEKNAESGRLSVTAPIDCPQPGSNWSTIVYSFMCKNSCSLGMNRRATAIIFTLERPNGEVIGRKLINIRICSCPRRDMGKDEKDLAEKTEKVESVQDDNEDNEDRHKNDKADNEDNTIEDNGDLSDEDKKEVKKVKVKKPLKRLSKRMVNFNLRTVDSNVKAFAKVIMEMIKMNENYRELTPEEKITLQDCAAYLN